MIKVFHTEGGFLERQRAPASPLGTWCDGGSTIVVPIAIKTYLIQSPVFLANSLIEMATEFFEIQKEHSM